MTNVVALLYFVVTTNWVTEPITSCTNLCCKDRWPATVRQAGVVTTNAMLSVTNQRIVYSVPLWSATARTRETRTVQFGTPETDTAVRVERGLQSGRHQSLRDSRRDGLLDLALG